MSGWTVAAVVCAAIWGGSMAFLWWAIRTAVTLPDPHDVFAADLADLLGPALESTPLSADELAVVDRMELDFRRAS